MTNKNEKIQRKIVRKMAGLLFIGAALGWYLAWWMMEYTTVNLNNPFAWIVLLVLMFLGAMAR